MLKKRLKKYICFLSAVVIAFSSYCLNVSAAQTNSNTYKISMARPSTGSSTGYMEVLLEDSSGGRFVRVFSWNVVQRSSVNNFDFEENDYPLRVVVSPSKVVFEFLYWLSDDSNVSWYELEAYIMSFSSGNSYQIQHFSGDEDSWTYSSSDYSVISYHVYGNHAVSESGMQDTEFYVLYADEVVQYNQFMNVLSIITQLANNDETIISQLDNIRLSNSSINDKLSQSLELLTSISSKLTNIDDKLFLMIGQLDDIDYNTDELEYHLDEVESQLNIIINYLNNENLNTPKPDTSTTDDYAAKEEALIGGTAAGREEANTVFTDFNSTLSDNVGRGLLAVTAIFREFTNISWLDSLIKFSLALGVFGFILGMGFFLVSSSANREARSERKQVNKLRSDYYKSGAEYYKSRSDK